MGERSEVDGLLDWLEASGRALELRVVRAFRRHAQVRHSVHYIDKESGKPREVDVLARFYGSHRTEDRAQLDVVIECKTGKAGSQWVAFRDENASARFLPERDLWLTASQPGKRRRFAEAWNWDPPFVDRVNASSIVTAHDGKDTAHGAVQQLLSAVDGQIEYVRRFEAKTVDRFNEESGTSESWSEREAGVIGIVVTTLPIYLADLDDTNSPRVEPVDIVAVPQGRADPAASARVFIARESALQRIARDLNKLAERL